jgi:hypothetical protein
LVVGSVLRRTSCRFCGSRLFNSPLRVVR